VSPLAENLLWLSDGHASDLALSVLADGQDELLGPDLHQHVHTCDACGVRFAALAALSLELGAVLQQSKPARETRAAAVKAIVIGLSTLTAAVLWQVAGNVSGMLRTLRLLPTLTPVVHKHAHGAVDFALAWYQTPGGLLASFLAALALVTVGSLVARSQLRVAREVTS